MLVDLHMHSYYSDGSFSPKEIVELAKKKGLGFISITDHNTVQAHEEFELACQELGMKYVVGVELDCVFGNRSVHLLAYDFKLNEEFAAIINKSRHQLDQMGVDLIKIMEKEYDHISSEDYESYTYDRRLGGFKGIHYLHDRGFTETVMEGLKIYRDYEVFYRDYEFPTVEEAIKQIHACGGKAVLAHPGKYYKNSTMDEVVADFEKLVDSHLDGIECYYPIHSEELTKCCVDFCNAHDLMITVGCDCHGEMSKKDGEYVMGCIQKDESELVLKF
ncbi:MAG: PHP domain-containing protein [Turicibacter sp.]|nr:PHP domain-containing protein [Turicibacter sp.]